MSIKGAFTTTTTVQVHRWTRQEFEPLASTGNPPGEAYQSHTYHIGDVVSTQPDVWIAVADLLPKVS